MVGPRASFAAFCVYLQVILSAAYTFDWVNLDAGGWVTGLAVHAPSKTVFARTDVGGAYKSGDGGHSWDWISGNIPGATSWGTYCLVPDPQDVSGGTVLLGIGNPQDDSLQRPWAKPGVWRTTNGGEDWYLVLSNVTFNANGPWRYGGECLSFDPSAPSSVWAGTQSGLWRSDSSGAADTWYPVEAFNRNSDVFNASIGGIAGIAFRGTLEQPHLGGPSEHAVPREQARSARQVEYTSKEVWVVGPQSVAISLDGGSSWSNAASFGNASGFGLVGGIRARRCLNGTTFLSATTASFGTDAAAEVHGDKMSSLLLDSYEARSMSGFRSEEEAPGFLSKTPPSVLVRVDASNWTDPATYTWTQLSGKGREKDGSQGLPAAAGMLYALEVLYEESTLVASFATGSFGVSRDGGLTFSMKQRTQLRGPGQVPFWFPGPQSRNVSSGGYDRIVVDPTDPTGKRWLTGTGFYPASTVDEGNSWEANVNGVGEVVMYPAQQHPYVPNRTFVGAMDLCGFMLDGPDNTVSWAMMAHEPVGPPYNSSWFSVDYCHRAAFWPPAKGMNSSGVMRMACNQHVSGKGQWMESSDGGITWNMTFSTQVEGINADVPFVDLLQSPDNPDDLLMTTGWGWYKNTSATEGMWRSTNGGKSWTKATKAPPSGSIGNQWNPSSHLQADPVNEDVRYWNLNNAGVYQSRDRGDTWNECDSQPFAGSGVLNAGIVAVYDMSGGFGGKAGQTVLFAAGQSREVGDGLQVSYDECSTWSRYPGSNFTWHYPMGSSDGPMIDAHESGVIAVTMGAGAEWFDTFTVWASTDFGRSWTNVADLSRGQAVRASGIYIDRWDPARLIISTGGRSIAVVDMAE